MYGYQRAFPAEMLSAHLRNPEIYSQADCIW
jgi:hypothetical protein